jgi:hypothetical protein
MCLFLLFLALLGMISFFNPFTSISVIVCVSDKDENKVVGVLISLVQLV